MVIKRKYFQGVFNITRFNWHFYILGIMMVIVLLFINQFLSLKLQPFIKISLVSLIFSIIVSLLTSFYIYDISDFYQLKWIDNMKHESLLNVNAGFDETSQIIKSKFSDIELIVCDFYNPKLHSEISIKRARKVYHPFKETISVTTDNLPFKNNQFDKILGILSFHEIRDQNERIVFFKELNRILKHDGQIFITEHLRNLNNFLAYNIGFFHFYTRKTWIFTFEKSNFKIKKEIQSTPFITTFIIEKINGDSL